MLTKAQTHPFNGSLSGTAQESRYQKGKTNLDFTEARDREWQWHQLGHMQSVPRSRQPASHHSSFFTLPAAQPTNSVKALKAAKLCEAKHSKQTTAVCNQPHCYKNSQAM